MVSEWIGDDDSGAVFSEDRIYRYTLWRRWEKPDMFNKSICSDMLCVIGLNPSTADETKNDPTITRCIGFAKRWGYNGLIMLNAFAFRSTCPIAMRNHPHPIGPDNDRAIQFVVSRAGRTIIAWGNHGSHENRSRDVKRILFGRTVYHFGLTKSGEPKHPLYLRSDSMLTAIS